MQVICSYPAVMSGSPLVSRVCEVAWSLPLRGHGKATSFFLLKLFPVCQNFVWCVCFCSHHVAFTMSQLSTTKLIFHTHWICFQSSFFFFFFLSKQENYTLLSIKTWSISYDSRWLSLSILIGLGSIVTKNKVQKRLQNIAPFQLITPSLDLFISASPFLF